MFTDVAKGGTRAAGRMRAAVLKMKVARVSGRFGRNRGVVDGAGVCFLFVRIDCVALVGGCSPGRLVASRGVVYWRRGAGGACVTQGNTKGFWDSPSGPSVYVHGLIRTIF